MDGFVLSPELKRAVQDLVRQYSNSFQPRPLGEPRPRQFIPDDPTPSQAAEDIRALTTTTGSPATGIVGGPLTPGTGFARLYTMPADTTVPGTPWQPGELVLYENWAPSTVAINKAVLLRKSRPNVNNGSDLYVIVTEPCKETPTA